MKKPMWNVDFGFRNGRFSHSAFRIPHSAFIMMVVGLLCGWSVAGAETVNRIVAIVNQEVITEADVASHLNAFLEGQGEERPADMNSADMYHAMLERLIEHRLMLQEAKQAGITVSSDRTLDRLDAIRHRFESEEAFQGSLAEAGLSEEQLKDQIRDQLMVQDLIDTKVRSTIVVSPQEVAREISLHPETAKTGERVRVSHILIRVNDQRSAAEAEKLIRFIKEQVSHGTAFAALAKQYSEDPQGPDGGELGWVAEGELMPELDASLRALQAGQVSDPIQSKLGFHLLKVEERRQASSLPILEANQAVYQQLYQKKFQEAFTHWLSGVKNKAYIEILAEPAHAG